MSQDTAGFFGAAASARCPRCGGSDLIGGVQMGLTAEVGSLGLRYRAAKIFSGVEAMRAELCRGCGTVVRFYVKETNRNWSCKE